MPNHVTNWVEISGSEEAIAKLRAATITKPTEPEHETSVLFDFNGIVKMPDELHDTVSSPQVVETEAEAEQINADYAKHRDGKFPGVDQSIRAISVAEQARRLTEYGAVDWYGFANSKWGTKWGAYEATEYVTPSPTKLVLEFQTAWSPPEPIFDHLSEPNQFTDEGFTVHAFWQDEDPSNSGNYGQPWDVFDIDMTARVEYLG